MGDTTTTRPTARLVTEATPPDDALVERCDTFGMTARERYLSCDRPKGHDGDHWDGADERYWRTIPTAEAVPA